MDLPYIPLVLYSNQLLVYYFRSPMAMYRAFSIFGYRFTHGRYD
ncbi:hypothetical protein HMPREF1556_00292 [Porphyromonas sp. oral taxon 278 str. W7784]|nr:hypothetical protein HMPREF1556_00292 [Porphyromonas sp. oral taxon 278 str. W7784]